MPATYEPIANYTVTNTSTNTINFNSIPSTYTDLRLVQSLPNDPTSTYGYSRYRFNSDTASNYSTNYFYWYNAATAGRQNNQTSILNGTSSYLGNTNIMTDILSYSSTSRKKSLITRANFSANGGGVPQEIWLSSALWRSTSAITSVTIFIDSGNYSSGSTFSLYGIKSA